jgi:hypothetical protein
VVSSRHGGLSQWRTGPDQATSCQDALHYVSDGRLHTRGPSTRYTIHATASRMTFVTGGPVDWVLTPRTNTIGASGPFVDESSFPIWEVPPHIRRIEAPPIEGYVQMVGLEEVFKGEAGRRLAEAFDSDGEFR